MTEPVRMPQTIEQEVDTMKSSAQFPVVFVLLPVLLATLAPAPAPPPPGPPARAALAGEFEAEVEVVVSLYECWWYNEGCPPWILEAHQVRFFGEDKLAGLAPSPYEFDNLASSIQFFNAGYIAVLYEHPNYGGASVVILGDAVALGADRLEHRASSMRIVQKIRHYLPTIARAAP